VNRLNELALFCGESGVEQEFGHPQYPVHWRTDLVADARQKLGLGFALGLTVDLGVALFDARRGAFLLPLVQCPGVADERYPQQQGGGVVT
jgi:hypothetical protein